MGVSTKRKGGPLAGHPQSKSHITSPDHTKSGSEKSSTGYAALVLARRFGLSPARASLVADLAGFAPILPALIEGARHA